MDRFGRSEKMGGLIVGVSPYTSRSIEDEDMHRIRFLEPLYKMMRDLYPTFVHRQDVPYEGITRREAYDVVRRGRKTVEKNRIPVKIVDKETLSTVTLGVSPLCRLIYTERYDGEYYPLSTGDIAKVIPRDIIGGLIRKNALDAEIQVYNDPDLVENESKGIMIYMNIDKAKVLFNENDAAELTKGLDAVVDSYGRTIEVGDIGYFSLHLKRRLPPTGWPLDEIEQQPEITRDEIEQHLCTAENSKGEKQYMNLAQFYNFSNKPKKNTLFEWDRPDIELDEFDNGLLHQKKSKNKK